MRDDLGHGDATAARGTVAGVAAGGGDATIVLPRPLWRGTTLRLPHPALRVSRPAYGVLALGLLVAGCLALVVFATAGPDDLVSSSGYAFPGWLAGPLHGLFGRLISDPATLSYGFSAVLVVMTVAYGVALASVRLLSMRTIVIVVVAVHAVILLGPPLQLTDLFNYLGYARLGALHHLNPYTHVIAAEVHDPVYGLTSWHHLHSPYGYAFTLLTYPLGLMPLPVAYWVLKTATVLASLAFIALVWRCARQLGRDPRFAVLFVAANPIFLVYELGGFHNDVFMLVPAMAAISLLLDGRDRWSGAALALAVAVKFTMVLLLPFLLLAARPPARRTRFVAGAAAAAVPLAAVSVAAFGFTPPNLSDQSSLLTSFSVPNLLGLLLGLGGGAPILLRTVNVALVLVVALLVARVARGRHDWLSAAGFGTLALVASLAWLMPWYVVWALPLAAVGASLRLRRVALATTVFLVLTFLPVTGIALTQLHLNPMGSAVGIASNVRAQKLAH
ncbi:MAG TPA: glycosyltransferase 87 family protein [Solirubrobacteraceae bacterium]|nr:glycosyltransferase 87 family protein [Solirubrobacteraceae bacterium]